jgi:hypothetical protein
MSKHQKAIAAKGDKVVIEDNEDMMFEVVGVMETSHKLPKARSAYWTNVYEVKRVDPGARKNMENLFVEQQYVLGKVEFKPLSFSEYRHFELVNSLGGYEYLREALHKLPHSSKQNHSVSELIRLVENCALLIEGDDDERRDAQRAIAEIIQ